MPSSLQPKINLYKLVNVIGLLRFSRATQAESREGLHVSAQAPQAPILLPSLSVSLLHILLSPRGNKTLLTPNIILIINI